MILFSVWWRGSQLGERRRANAYSFCLNFQGFHATLLLKRATFQSSKSRKPRISSELIRVGPGERRNRALATSPTLELTKPILSQGLNDEPHRKFSELRCVGLVACCDHAEMALSYRR